MAEKNTVPPVLWIAIISLAVFSFVHIVQGFSHPLQFIAAAINVLLIIGLLRLAKWAYFASIIASILAPVVLSFEGSVYSYFILIINLTVLIPVVWCTKSFFNGKQRVATA